MHDWRYAPSTITTRVLGKFRTLPVASYHVWPPNTSPKESPIKRDMVTLECRSDVQGASAWYGVDEAKINSELKMIVRGGFINPRNELSAEHLWLPVKEGLI